MFSRRAMWAAGGSIVLALMAAPVAMGADTTTMRFANFGSREVACFVDDALECRLPPRYECNFKVAPGKHIVEIIRPDNSGYRDAFSLPAQMQGHTYFRGEYLIGDNKVDYRLPLSELAQPPAK
jgi:hypothetical protein